MNKKDLVDQRLVCSKCVEKLYYKKHNISGNFKCYYCNSTINAKTDDFIIEETGSRVKRIGRNKQ